MPSPKKAQRFEPPRALIRIQVPSLPTRRLPREPTIVTLPPEELNGPMTAQQGLTHLAGQLDDLAEQLSALAAALERLAASLQKLDAVLRNTLDLTRGEAERVRRLIGGST